MEKIEQLYGQIINKLEQMGENTQPLDYFINEYILLNKLDDKYPLMDSKIKDIFEQALKDLNNEELTLFYSYCIDIDEQIRISSTNKQLAKLSLGLLQLNENDRFLDLGSGTGLLIKDLLDNYKISKVTGIELVNRLYLISKMILSNYNGVELINDNYNSLHLDFTKAFLNPGIKLKNYSRDSSLESVDTLIRLLKESETDKRAVIILRGTHLYSNRFKEQVNSIIKTGFVEGIISGSSITKEIILVLTTEQHDSIKLLDGNLRRYEEANIDEVVKAYFNNIDVIEVKNEILLEEENIEPSSIRNRLLVDEMMKNYKTVHLGDICDINIGSQYTFNILENKYDKLSKRNLGPAFKIIKASDIDEDGQIDYEELPYYSVDKINNDRLAKRGDIIITSKTTNYKVCVLDDLLEEDYVIPSGGMFILRLKNRISPYYLKAFFESDSGKLAMDGAFKGETVKVLNLTSLSNVLIPILDDSHDINEVINQYHRNMRRISRYKKEIKDLERKSKNEANKIFK